MAIKPSTNLSILKVPLQINNKNQLTFKNETEQYNYFGLLPSLDIEASKYQRKDSVIRYPRAH